MPPPDPPPTGGMDAPSSCPGIAALESLAERSGSRGEVPDNDPVAAHVRTCAACSNMFREMRSADEFLERFRGVAMRSADAEALNGDAWAGLGPGPAPVQVDGYAVERLIAFGGQGAVYRAIQKGTGRLVAIKVPLGDTKHRPATRYRFEREVELAARLDHPGVVRIFGACTLQNGRLGYVMEYVEGQSLDSWASERRAEGHAGLRRIVGVVVQVADAIGYAHLRAVLHRDIKPGNVIVTEGDKARVLDFGLAKSLDSTGSSFATMTGAFLGTLAYAAPEQIDGGNEATDVRTDVYAIGLLLFNSLTGALPYSTDGSTTEMLRQIRQVAPVRPSTLSRATDGDLDAIVIKALAKEKERRYATAIELRDDLHAWLLGRAVQARFDSRWYVWRKTIQRHRRAVLSGATVLFATSVGLTVSSYYIAKADAAHHQAVYDRARASSELVRANAVQQVIDELMPFEDGPAASGGGTTSRNLELLERKLDAGLLRGQPILEASVRSMVGSIHSDRGRYGHAELHVRHALRLYQITYGDTSHDTLRTANSLATILIYRGKLAEAEHLARSTLAQQTRILSDSHPDVLESTLTLARVALANGRASQAMQLVEGVQSRIAASPGHSDALAASAIIIAADIAIASGRADDAVALAEQAATACFRLYSDEHPDVSRAIRRIGRAERLVGNVDEGDALERVATAIDATRASDRSVQTWNALLDVKKQLLEPNHPQIATTLVLRGLAQQTAGEWTDALASMSEAVSILEEAHGPDSLATLDCTREFWESLMRTGQLVPTEELAERRYRVYKQVLAHQFSTLVVVAHREWARMLGEIGRDDEALIEFEQLQTEIREIAHGDPLETLRVHIEMAEIHAARGNDAVAWDMANKVLDTTGDNEQLASERNRARTILVMDQILRGDIERAEQTMREVARARSSLEPGLFTSQQVERRIVTRWLRAYHVAGLREPDVFKDLRRIYQIGTE